MKTYLFKAMDMTSPKQMACDTGTIVLFTTRSPIKETVNEDTCAVYHLGDDACVLAVADGMGGLPQGHAASEIVVDSLKQTLDELSGETSYRDAILNGVEVANKSILDATTGSGSTVAIVEIFKNTIRPYHVGDSKILVVGQRGKVKLETLSHSPTEYAVEAGYLAPNEAIEHEDRRYITNMIGAPDMRIELGSPLQLSRYDTLLLSSDGLVDNIHHDEIVEIIRKGKLLDCMESLINLCRSRMTSGENSNTPSAPDDVTIMLYRPL